MIRRAWAGRRYIWIAVFIVSYATLAHYTNSNPHAKSLGAVLAIAPPLALALGFAWRSAYRLLAIALGVLAALLLITHWHVAQRIFPQFYLLQECGVYALLGFTFARTLLPGQVPICTHWATLVHGPLPAQVARYTRNTTAAWALFFALITLVSLVLFQYAPLKVWSAFANFLTIPLVLLMFVGEYTVRRRILLPPHRTGLLDSVKVYFDSSRYAATSRL